jgi:spore germination cell wall hydrolase CwlJ-like protein
MVGRQDKERELKKLLGARGLSAVAGLCIFGLGSSAAAAQAQAGVTNAVAAAQVDLSATPLGKPVQSATTVVRAAATTATNTVAAVATATGNVLQPRPAASVSVTLAPAIAREAAWLYQNGWPLYALVDRYSTGAPLNEEANCLATAVYFEARGETLEGQLAVARVVMNRAASGRYPPSWCEVVKQPYQFSFVRSGQFPAVDQNCEAWRKAQAIARLAISNVIPSVSSDVLWYHADYVAPSWGQRLNRVSKIGAHIFYRA